MEFFNKNLKYIIGLLSIFFILQAALLFYNTYHYTKPEPAGLLLRYILMIGLYAMLFFQIYRLRKIRYAATLLAEILVLAVAASAFLVIPVVFAKTSGVITTDVGYLYIAEANLLFAVFLSVTAYLTKYISFGLSKAMLLVSLNAVFLINCVAIGILYTTGFEIGPTVFLHFSWEAARIGLRENLLLFLALIAFLVPINIAFAKLIKSHKDSVVNYAVVCLAVLAVLVNSIILNFDTYKTKAILPVYSLLETAFRYSDSTLINLREEYNAISIDDREMLVLDKLGINLTALSDPETIIPPTERKNLITIYLESFQLNFTRHGGDAYPGLTPNLDALSDDYVVYKNFFNSVTPTINAMISSQCGVDIMLSTDEFIRGNNQVLNQDAVAQDLLHGNLVCLSDTLHDAGYYQVLMKGADIRFSGTGAFFESHHYDQTLGQAQLNPDNRYADDLNVWGLQDPILIAEALNKIEELKDKQPFNLTFLTLNSHTPGFEYPECPVYDSGNAMLNGIHCTDYALGLFMDKLVKMDIYRNTVVVIVGDHVMFDSISNNELLSRMPLSWFGRTYLAIRTPDSSLDHSPDIFGITPDLAPTLLELLDFRNASFISGKSLFGARREHQRITTSNFDIVDDEIIPVRMEGIMNDCPIADASNVRLYDIGQYSKCQRAKAYYLQQKSVLSIY